MRRLLIVSPHFPPSDAVDMHRVRSGVNFYSKFGWKPSVLAISPETAGWPIEERLCGTIPDDLDIHRVNAADIGITRRFGLTAAGLRAWVPLARAGAKLLSGGAYDLVYISTTQFPVMTLGTYWKRRFGVPFVLDFQDPWFNADFIDSQRRLALKYRAMRRVHRMLEGMTVPEASGIIAVSQNYIDVFRKRYPGMGDIPAAEIPFGFNRKDIEVSHTIDEPFEIDESKCVGFYAGRAGRESVACLRLLMNAFCIGRRDWPDVFGPVRLRFVGTKYSGRDTQAFVAEAAQAFGLSEAVSEQTDRIAYFNALDALTRSDFSIVLGSDDPAYRPSKLAMLAEVGLPVVAAVGRGSVLQHALRAFPSSAVGVVPVAEADLEAAAADLAERWRQILCADDRAHENPVAKHTVSGAEALAEQECGIFDRAILQP